MPTPHCHDGSALAARERKDLPAVIMAPTLKDIAALIDATVHHITDDAAAQLSLSTIALDSRKVESGGIFAALPGTKIHGAHFAGDTPGAAILTDAQGVALLAEQQDDRPILEVPDVRAVLGIIAARIYDDPSADLTVIGITGTSGKTTTSYLLEAGLMAAGKKVGLIGTTGTRINGEAVPTQLTTPEAPTLQALLRRMAAEGVTHVVMEVSSHALALGRVQGVQFDVAGFTNLSQDHLDFHPTMAEYFETKALFFKPDSPLHARCSVICIDDQWGKDMLQLAGPAARSLSLDQDQADYRVTGITSEATGGQHFDFRGNGHELAVDVPLPGRFNIANAALALALADVVGISLADVATGISHVGVPGRMERVDVGQEFLAVVDYAHKPAAVAAVLDTVRAQVPGRIGVVIGAGGDRDRSKRSVMGAKAAERADLVIITDDNPRSEDPAVIRAVVLAGAREAATDTAAVDIREIGDRRNAIIAAVEWAQPGDGIVIAGKGHEVGQLIAGVNHHFDDREELRAALVARFAQKGQL